MTLKIEIVRKLLSERRFEIDSANHDNKCILCHQIMIHPRQGSCGCYYCYKCISDYLKNVGKYCPGNTLECNNKELKESILNGKESPLIVKCIYCKVRLDSLQMVEHLQSCNNQSEGNSEISNNDFMTVLKMEVEHLKSELKDCRIELAILKEETNVNKREIFLLKNECVCKTSESRVNMANEIQKSTEEMTDNIKCETIALNKDENVENEIEKLKTELLTQMVKANESIDSNVNKINELNLNYIELERKLGQFEYVWRVDNFSGIVHKKLGVIRELCSDEFYADCQRYRMRLSMYRHKYESEKYLVIYWSLVVGAYDSIVRWPFMGRVTLGVIDQRDGTVMFPFVAQYETESAEVAHTFQRPKKKCFEGYGYDIELQQLKECPGLVVKDTMFVKCTVTFHGSVDLDSQ